MALDATVILVGLVVSFFATAVVTISCFVCCCSVFAASSSVANQDGGVGGVIGLLPQALTGFGLGSEQSNLALCDRPEDPLTLGSRAASAPLATIPTSARTPIRTVPSTCSIVEIDESPRPDAVQVAHNGHHAPAVPHAGAIVPALSKPVGGVVATPRPLSKTAESALASLHVLKAGYAAQLAFQFGDARDIHRASVTAVSNAFGLDETDICYSSLCLEQASKGVAKSRGKVERRRDARVWIVALARFVLHAQGLQNAANEDHAKMPCAAWGYAVSEFMREVLSTESAFHKQYGFQIVGAFQNDAFRLAELSRANSILQVLSNSSGVSIPPSLASSSGLQALSLASSSSLKAGGKRLALGDVDANSEAAPRKRQRGGARRND